MEIKNLMVLSKFILLIVVISFASRIYGEVDTLQEMIDDVRVIDLGEFSDSFKVSYRLSITPRSGLIQEGKDLGVFDRSTDAAFLKDLNNLVYDCELYVDKPYYKFKRIDKSDSSNYRNVNISNFDGVSYGYFAAHEDVNTAKLVDGQASISKNPFIVFPLVHEIYASVPVLGASKQDQWISLKKILSSVKLRGEDVLIGLNDEALKNGELVIALDRAFSKFKFGKLKRAVRLRFKKNEIFRLSSSEVFYYRFNSESEIEVSSPIVRAIYEYEEISGLGHLSLTGRPTHILKRVKIEEFRLSSTNRRDEVAADKLGFTSEPFRVTEYGVWNFEISPEGEDIAIHLPEGTKIFDGFSKTHFVIGSAEENLESLSSKLLENEGVDR